MNNQFGMMGGIYGGQPMMGLGPFSTMNDEDLLKELRNFAMYGVGQQNFASQQLLHTLFQRFESNMRKTNAPTRDIQGGGHLFTSIYKDDVITHYFVDHQATKERIDQIFEATKLNTEMTEDQARALTQDRINALMELGACFRAETVDTHGRRLDRSIRCHYNTIIGEGFGTDSLHPSKNLPVLAIDVPYALINGFDRDKFHEFIHHIAGFKPGLIDLEKLDRYFAEVDVLDQYKTDLNKALPDQSMRFDAWSSQPVQVWIRGKGQPIQIKLLGGTHGVDQWTKGFLGVADYPEIVVIPKNNRHFGPGFSSPGSMF